MGILVKGADLRKLVKEKGLPWTKHHLQESFDKKEITPEDFNLRDMFKNMVEGGREAIDKWELDRQRGGHVTEAIHAIDTGAMASITGQVFFNAIQDAMTMDTFIGDSLVSPFPSNLQGEEKVPGISVVGDEFAGNVTEGEPYPPIAVSENYITIPEAEKKGGIIGVTKEALIADRTGIIIERMRSLGSGLGLRREKSIIDVVIGAVNPYAYKGEARLTYGDGATAGEALGFINEATAALVNYTDMMEIAEVFYNIHEADTNEPLSHSPDTLICGGNLSWTAKAVLRDTTVELVDRAAAAAQVGSIGANRIPEQFQVKIATNEWVTQRLLLAGTAGVGGLACNTRDLCNAMWFIGKPTKAFCWKIIWPLTVVEEPANSVVEFEQDVVMRFKASYKGVAGVREPRYMIRSDGTA